MKLKYLLFAGLLSFGSINIYAQDEVRLIEAEETEEVKKEKEKVESVGDVEVVNTAIDVSEERKVMFLGAKNAMVIDFPGDPKFVDKSWKEYMNKYGKTKKVKKSKEMGTEGISVMSIGGTETISVYNLTSKGSKGTEMTTWIKKGDEFVSSDDPDTYDAALEFMHEFSIKLHKDIVAEELTEEEKVLKKMLSDLKKLKRDNENYHKE
ncbi:MAG: hypothetical protein AAGK97_01355 [Bacteroidota bacterium]